MVCAVNRAVRANPDYNQIPRRTTTHLPLGGRQYRMQGLGRALFSTGSRQSGENESLVEVSNSVKLKEPR
jgi:hypothetical protein